MNMKKIVSFLCAVVVLSTLVFSVYAQEVQEPNQEENEFSAPVRKSRYTDNWFVSLGGSANLLFAEQDKLAPFSKRVKFGGEFSVGKWFRSDFGARLQVNAGGLKGYNRIDSPDPINPKFTNNGAQYAHKGDPNRMPFPIGGDLAGGANPNYKYEVFDGKNGFWQEFNYQTITLDLLANATELARGYHKEGNLFDVIPFAGLGYIRALDNGNTTPNFHNIVVNLGIRVNVNINRNWAIYVEPKGSLVYDEFDGYMGDALGDAITNLSLGIQYSFDRQGFNCPIECLTAEEIGFLNDKINDNRRRIDNHDNVLDDHQNQLDDLKKCCDEKPEPKAQEPEPRFLPEYVRFALDSYVIRQSERSKIDDAVEFLKRYPTARLFMIGYADRQTGNPKYNMKLSEKRVKAVAKQLETLGVNPNRLVLEWRGDSEQPYMQNDWNRVVVMVER
jgi:outer membrane protein OmpA-like peptidoglycan-associated protein